MLMHNNRHIYVYIHTRANIYYKRSMPQHISTLCKTLKFLFLRGTSNVHEPCIVGKVCTLTGSYYPYIRVPAVLRATQYF